MTYYAYDLNLPVDALRKDLKDFWYIHRHNHTEEQKQGRTWGTGFTNDQNAVLHFHDILFKECGLNAVEKFKEHYNNYFLKSVRFIYLTNDANFTYHIDHDQEGQGMHMSEVPKFTMIPTTLNVLIEGDTEVETDFAIDLSLTKLKVGSGKEFDSTDVTNFKMHQEGNNYYWANGMEKNFKVMDTFKQGNNASIINTQTMHRVGTSPGQTRLIASLFFWPLHSYENIVQISREKGFLIER